MSGTLDNVVALRQLDPQDMLGWVERFPEQYHDAWRIAEGLSLPDSCAGKAKIVVAGMGGSAIGGDMVAALLASEMPVPVTTVRGYTLPAWVDENTLVIASSYSGNTEETLSAFAQALDRGAAVVALTTGGELSRQALDRGLPVVTFPGGGQPRAALGYSLVLLLGILEALGYYSLPAAARAEAAQVLETLNQRYGPDVPERENTAKRYARMAHDRIVFAFGAGHMIPVARRWKTQFNENSKRWSGYDEMSELNHNLIVGLRFPHALAQVMLAFSLESDLDHPRIQLRWRITADLFQQSAVPLVRVRAPGTYAFTQMLALVHLGDFVTVYRALLDEQDPSEIDNIVYLKRALATTMAP